MMTTARLAAALAAGITIFAVTDLALASERQCPRSVAEVRAGGRVVWCAPTADVVVITRAVWSRSRHAVAFATESSRGEQTLEVVLIGGRADLHAVSWAIPDRVQRARGRGAPAVTWLGSRRVGFGYSELRPALVASWTGGD